MVIRGIEQTPVDDAPVLPGAGAAWSTRKQLLYQHLTKQRYICDVGRDYARNDSLMTTELPHEQGDHQSYEHISPPIHDLLRKGAGSVVIILPKEPVSYEALRLLVRRYHADIVTAVLVAAIRDNVGSSEKLLEKDPGKKMALDAIRADDVVARIGLHSTANIHMTLAIRGEVEKILGKSPNAVPMYGDRALFTIVLSSMFQDEHEQIRAAARESYGVPNIPHQRYSPVTCLVVNWHDEIMRVMHSPIGKIIERKMVTAPYFLNANEVLTAQYGRVDAVFDAYVRMCYQIQQAMPPLAAMEQAQLLHTDRLKFQLLYGMLEAIYLSKIDQFENKITGQEFARRCMDFDALIKREMAKDILMFQKYMETLTGGSLGTAGAWAREFLKQSGEPAVRPVKKQNEPIRHATPRVRKNDPCTCGCGRKFKHCPNRK